MTKQTKTNAIFDRYIEGISVVAVLIAVTTLTGVSMTMNYIAGASFSDVPFYALLLGLVMIGTDTAKMFCLGFIGSAWRQERYIQAFGAAIMMGLCVTLSLFAGSKFATDARVARIAERADVQPLIAYDKAERDRLNAQLQNPTTNRGVAEIDAQITGLLQRRFGGQSVANATASCTDIGRIGQRTCAAIAELRQEKAAAQRYAELRARRDALNTAARAAQQAAPKRDVQAEQYAKILGMTPADVAFSLAMLVAITAEIASIFFLFFVRRYLPLFMPPADKTGGQEDHGTHGVGLNGAGGRHDMVRDHYGANGISCGNPECPHEHDQVSAARRPAHAEPRSNGFDRHF